MKTFRMGLAALMAVCSMAGCTESDNVVDEPMDGAKEITFDTGMRIGVVPWTNGFEVNESRSRAPLSDCAKFLRFYDYMDGELKQSLSQAAAGTFKVRMLFGDHDLRFLAYNSEEDAPDESGASFTPAKVLDTFLCNEPMKVETATEPEKVVKMNRVVGKLTVVLEDPIPEGVKSLRLTMGKFFGTLNMADGFAMGKGAECSRSWNVSASLVGKVGQMVSMFTFIPADGMKTSVMMEALGEGDETLFARYAEDVPVKMNCCTTANCKLFSTEGGFTFEIAEDWEPGLSVDM